MFNHNRAAEGPKCVEITLENGQALRGRFILPPERTLTELLNGGNAFVEFEPFGGERTYLAKSSLRLVTPINVPPNPTLAAGARDANGFDPYAVLGIAHGADKEEVRRAYLALAKVYHPDRYATVELPSEVSEYLAAMARRINAAHDALAPKPHDGVQRQEPIFTTGSRA